MSNNPYESPEQETEVTRPDTKRRTWKWWYWPAAFILLMGAWTAWDSFIVWMMFWRRAK
jgi:hypothetical protein